HSVGVAAMGGSSRSRHTAALLGQGAPFGGAAARGSARSVDARPPRGGHADGASWRRLGSCSAPGPVACISAVTCIEGPHACAHVHVPVSTDAPTVLLGILVSMATGCPFPW